MWTCSRGGVKCVQRNLLKFQISRSISKAVEKIEEEGDGREVQEQIWSKGPYLPPTFNIAGYANDSENVKRLVGLGVELAKWEGRYGAIPILFKSNYETVLQPVITFLQELGVDGPSLGRVLSDNPFLFNEQVANLDKRVEYLKLKKFTEEQVTHIVTKNPYWLSYNIPRIDRRLGFFQTFFALTGSQVRSLATTGSSGPRLITFTVPRIKDCAFAIQEEMGFTREETRQLLLAAPRIFQEDPKAIRARFDYLHNTENLPHTAFLQTPILLRTREHRLRHRIGFLRSLGRLQLDPRQPNYISFENLCVGSDPEWVTTVAKSSLIQFNDYLKTL